jgi:hypothetical protein
VRRVEQSSAGTGMRTLGDDFEGNLGQRRAYESMIADWEVRVARGVGEDQRMADGGPKEGLGWGRCDARTESRVYFYGMGKCLFRFGLRGC